MRKLLYITEAVKFSQVKILLFNHISNNRKDNAIFKERKGDDYEKQNKKKGVTIYYAGNGVVNASGEYILYKRSEGVFMARNIRW